MNKIEQLRDDYRHTYLGATNEEIDTMVDVWLEYTADDEEEEEDTDDNR